MSEMGVLVEVEDWPHGLRCGECECSLDEGDRYSERFEYVTADGIPVVLIVCVGCALTSNTDTSHD